MSLTLVTVRRSSRSICSLCAGRRFSTNSWQRQKSGHSFRELKAKLPQAPARTRFAPSPTGYLHLGSLRTALFNYLLAKATGGQFLLRIEDTDQKRTIPDAEKRIFEDLRWAGLEWDEGPLVGGPYGPYRQSERSSIYKEHADMLVKTGHAYRCFCSGARLNALAKERTKLGLPTDYDRTCAFIPEGESEDRMARGETHVVRLKVPNKYPEFQDVVYGRIGGRGKTLFGQGGVAFEDPILLKSDGLPTYHLANVVDDHLMKITHVVRATEWISSTPKHLFIYKAFGWEPPAFAHVGLLQDKSGQKLSKRHFDLDISAFREQMGILPEALVNYVALLGWSHNRRKDIVTLDQLVKNFDLKFTKGNTIVTFEKLWYLQRSHAKLRADMGGQEFEDLVDRVNHHAKENGIIDTEGRLPNDRPVRENVSRILRADAKNFTTSEDFWKRNYYFFGPITVSHYRTRNSNGDIMHPISVSDLVEGAKRIKDVPPESWDASTLQKKISEIVASSSMTEDLSSIQSNTDRSKAIKKQKDWNKGFHHYLRWAIAEGMQGPGIADSMEILGREVSLTRLREAAALAGAVGNSPMPHGDQSKQDINLAGTVGQ